MITLNKNDEKTLKKKEKIEKNLPRPFSFVTNNSISLCNNFKLLKGSIFNSFQEGFSNYDNMKQYQSKMNNSLRLHYKQLFISYI